MKTAPNFILAAAAALAIVLAPHASAADAPAKPSFAVKVTGKGKPVILIPGLSSSGAVWDGTVAHLKDRYECHVLTLAGFAGQPRIEPPFLETVRNDLAAYIREHKLDHPVIIGHSLGGFLADWLGAHDPGLPGPIIIVDALPFLPGAWSPGATAETMKPMAEQMRAQTSADQASFLASSETAVKGMVTKPADVDLVMTWVKASDRVAVGNAMYDLFTHDLRGDIAAITSPVLVLPTWMGFKDYTTRNAVEETTRKQYSAVKNCKVVMAETRHFIMLDDPQWFYKQVDAFLASPGHS
jgi:pimeloyl-ACP methyl ester carboxylesterase